MDNNLLKGSLLYKQSFFSSFKRPEIEKRYQYDLFKSNEIILQAFMLMSFMFELFNYTVNSELKDYYFNEILGTATLITIVMKSYLFSRFSFKKLGRNRKIFRAMIFISNLSLYTQQAKTKDQWRSILFILAHMNFFNFLFVFN